MSGTGIAGNVIVKETAIVSIISDVRNIMAKATEIETRSDALRFRLLGESRNRESKDGGAEPERQDIENLSHHLAVLQAEMDSIEENVRFLEAL